MRSLGADADHTLLRAQYQRALSAARYCATRLRAQACVCAYKHAVVCVCVTVRPGMHACDSATVIAHAARTHLELGAGVGVEVSTGVGLHNGTVSCWLRLGGIGMLALPYHSLHREVGRVAKQSFGKGTRQ